MEEFCFSYLKCINYIGLNNKIYSTHVNGKIIEIIRSKINIFSFEIIKKCQDNLSSKLYNELCIPFLITNFDDYNNFIKKYHFDNIEINNQWFQDIASNNNFIYTSKFDISKFNDYPLKLPFTNIVYDFINMFKENIEIIIKFVNPLFNEPSTKIEILSNEFIKKLVETYISFSICTQSEIPIILCAYICNNIKYCSYSILHLKEYLYFKINPKFQINLECKKNFEVAILAYEELIYEKLKKKLYQFISDLICRENEFFELRSQNENTDFEALISYLLVIFFIYFRLYIKN